MFVAYLDDVTGPRAELNDEQRVAATHEVDSPLRIVAGAGSGKTRTLAARVAWLIDSGVQPDRIMLLTFTRRASAEMLRRASGMTGGRNIQSVWGGTFHSIANRLLRQYGEAIGLMPGFTVLDQGDAADLFGIVRTESGLASGRKRFPQKATLATIYSRVINAQVPLLATIEDRFPWCIDHVEAIKDIVRRYGDRKKATNTVDYDDLLLYFRALLGSPLGGTVRSMFDHVLVDEYQDTNAVQVDILEALCGVSGSLTVVGDDAQAIYGFRAASADNLLKFDERFESVTSVMLEQNYRSTPQILELANAVMSRATDTVPKVLWSDRKDSLRPTVHTCIDEATQADVICDLVLERREHGVPLQDQAVLFRTGHHADGLEIELGRRNIPFVKYGGLKFIEAAHVKDLVAMLRVLDNPRDELAWHRVLELVPGVGPKTAARVLEAISRSAEDGVTEPLAAFMRGEFMVTGEARPWIARLREAFNRSVGDGQEPPVPLQIEYLGAVLADLLTERYDNLAVRLGDLDQLHALSAEYNHRGQFIAELTLDPPDSTSQVDDPHLDDDYLVLSTIHSAKGGEWDAVYVMHAADGNLPSDLALGDDGGLEEERRLFYVALTRARNSLDILYPQRFYFRRFGSDPSHTYAQPTRFLDGVDGLVTQVSAVPPVVEAPGDFASGVATVTDAIGALFD
jgi:ATP-dependent DNA helicase UvrD/PcrA